MSDIKYTSDGRKVKVIGNLNNQEKIVQEIYVQKDGTEIPSGENFTVKSLHDEPSKSWKEKDIERIEQRYNSEYKEFERKLSELRKRRRQKESLVKEKLSYLHKFIDNSTESFFDDLKGFLLGEFKYIVTEGWHPEIKEFGNKECQSDGTKLALVSLYGRDDGTINWEQNSYSDGSGSYRYKMQPFRTLKEAKNRLIEIFDEKESYSRYNIEEAEKWDIELDKEKLDAYKKEKIESLNKSIKEKEDSLSDLKKKLNEIES